MQLQAVLDRSINDGIEAATADYSRPEQCHQLAGSILGFNECRAEKGRKGAEKGTFKIIVPNCSDPSNRWRHEHKRSATLDVRYPWPRR